jgi:hypothetical protein
MLRGGGDFDSKYGRVLVGSTYKCVLNDVVAVGVKRNPAAAAAITLEQFFQGSTVQLNNCSTEYPGQIHGMGSAYAAILWEIYVHPKIDKRMFERAFQAHLQKLGASSDFGSAWSAIRADYLTVGGSQDGAGIIDAVFSRKGTFRPASF